MEAVDIGEGVVSFSWQGHPGERTLMTSLPAQISLMELLQANFHYGCMFVRPASPATQEVKAKGLQAQNQPAYIDQGQPGRLSGLLHGNR